MKKLCLCILFLISFSFASELIIDMSFEIDHNDNVKMKDLIVNKGDRQRFFTGGGGPYEVLVIDSLGQKLDSHSFDVSLWLLSDPPQKLDYSYHSYKLNYSKSADKLQIKHNEKVIFERWLHDSGTCIENGICEKDENAFGCFRDCEASANDSYCSGLSDSVCDPDCSIIEDSDCIPKFPGDGNSTPCLISLLIIPLVVVSMKKNQKAS